jgi:hypothetical protein
MLQELPRRDHFVELLARLVALERFPGNGGGEMGDAAGIDTVVP